jgi:hypothetical protein
LFIGGDFTSAGIQDYYTNHGIMSAANGVLLFQESGGFSSSMFNTVPNLSSSSISGTLYANNANGVQLAGGSVHSLCYINDGTGTTRLIVGGSFSGCYNGFNSLANPQLVSRNVAIMTVNNVWDNFSATQIPGLDAGEVNGIVRVGNNIYVGGQFTNLVSNNQVLNNFAYWDSLNYLWYSIVSGVLIGTSATVQTMEPLVGSNMFVGGSFTTGGSSAVSRVGAFNGASNGWTQYGSGVNATVRDIYYSGGTTAYICGEFTATGSGATPMYGVAKINLNTAQIEQITNNSTHTGMNGSVVANGTVNANVFISPNIYFGGIFTNTLPTSNLPMQNLSYFNTVGTVTPLVITTTTAGFLDTENGATWTQIVIPTRYKNVIIIYNSASSPQGLNKWLETYRSTGVTH